MPGLALGAVDGCPGAFVLTVAPLGDRRIVVVLQPSVRVGDLDAVQGVDVVAGRRLDQLPRFPALGFVPWLAFDVRAFIFFFSVFFDIGPSRLRGGRRGRDIGTLGTMTAVMSDRPPGGAVLGPDSLLWRYAGDTRIGLMGATIGLLQLAYPSLGAGVIEHSDFFDDPMDRVVRSLPRILGTVYDEQGGATGIEVRDLHKGIKGQLEGGERYHALDPHTFWWAHATFQFMAEQVVDRFDHHRLTRREREQLYAEGVEWYRRYGVSDRVVPPTRAEFQREWDRVCAEDLEMNSAVAFVLKMVDVRTIPPPRNPDIPPWLRPVLGSLPVRFTMARASKLAAVGGLPPIVRERFGLKWSRRDALDLALLEQAVATTWRFLPANVRWQPRALEGWKRERGKAP